MLATKSMISGQAVSVETEHDTAAGLLHCDDGLGLLISHRPEHCSLTVNSGQRPCGEMNCFDRCTNGAVTVPDHMHSPVNVLCFRARTQS